MAKPVIYKSIMHSLKNILTKKQWIEFAEALDGDVNNDFLEEVNEHVVKIAPEIFANPKGFSKPKK